MKFLSILFIALSTLTTYAQNISGQAFYQSKTTVNMDDIGRKGMDENMKKMIAERMKSYLEKTYVLTFNGKESKQIGQYVAFKATALKKIDVNDLSMARRRNSDDKKVDNEKETSEIKNDSITTKDPFDEIEIPKEILVTAWYTPMIPVKNGPGEYAGLPGLILELNFYRTTLLCSKIVMNPQEAEEIKMPKKGKVVTRAEYNKIIKIKMEEMRENFRNGGGRRGDAHMRGGN